jgi:hypothetical protein
MPTVETTTHPLKQLDTLVIRLGSRALPTSKQNNVIDDEWLL